MLDYLLLPTIVFLVLSLTILAIIFGFNRRAWLHDKARHLLQKKRRQGKRARNANSSARLALLRNRHAVSGQCNDTSQFAGSVQDDGISAEQPSSLAWQTVGNSDLETSGSLHVRPNRREDTSTQRPLPQTPLTGPTWPAGKMMLSVPPFKQEWFPNYSADIHQLDSGVIWAASRIGRRHTRVGLPCQDAFSVWSAAAMAGMAVADGVGSHPFSERSSRLAVSALQAVPIQSVFQGDWSDNAARIIEKVCTVVEDGFRNARVSDRVPGTTLVGAWTRSIGDRIETRWLSIGDSAIAVLEPLDSEPSNGGFHVLNVGPQLHNESTDSLPANFSRFESSVEYLVPGQLLLLASDGYFKQLEEQAPHTLNNISRVINGLGDPAQFLLALRHDGAGFDDDATAVLFQSNLSSEATK